MNRINMHFHLCHSYYNWLAIRNSPYCFLLLINIYKTYNKSSKLHKSVALWKLRIHYTDLIFTKVNKQEEIIMFLTKLILNILLLITFIFLHKITEY